LMREHVLANTPLLQPLCNLHAIEFDPGSKPHVRNLSQAHPSVDGLVVDAEEGCKAFEGNQSKLRTKGVAEGHVEAPEQAVRFTASHVEVIPLPRLRL